MQVLGSISGRGTKFHMTHLKILHATAKTWHSQIDKENKYLKKKKKKKNKKQAMLKEVGLSGMGKLEV